MVALNANLSLKMVAISLGNTEEAIRRALTWINLQAMGCESVASLGRVLGTFPTSFMGGHIGICRFLEGNRLPFRCRLSTMNCFTGFDRVNVVC